MTDGTAPAGARLKLLTLAVHLAGVAAGIALGIATFAWITG